MSDLKFVTPYYEPLTTPWTDDPLAKFYPNNYDISKVNVTPDTFYIVVNGSKVINDEEEGLSLYIEFMNKPDKDHITICEGGKRKHVAIFDSKIWDNFLNEPYSPKGPAAFINTFDVLVVYAWFNEFYDRFNPNDPYRWMQATTDTIKYFGKERCLDAIRFYNEFLSDTVHWSAIANIKKFARITDGYDDNHPVLVYSLYCDEPFGGLHHCYPIK